MNHDYQTYNQAQYSTRAADPNDLGGGYPRLHNQEIPRPDVRYVLIKWFLYYCIEQ